MEGLRQRRRVGAVDEGDDSKSKKPRITLESFDLYTKVQAEEQVQTTTGAGVTVVSLVMILILLLNELHGYLVAKQSEHVAVDAAIEGRLRINFDITFHALMCADVNLDAMDVAGEQQNGLDHDVVKVRLSPDGVPVGDAMAVNLDDDHEAEGKGEQPAPLPPDYCGSCYGAETREGQCCNTCDEVRNAYSERGWDVAGVTGTSEQCVREHRNVAPVSKPGEGCRISGFMMVNKVAGNFHIAMGQTHARGAGHIHQFNPQAFGTFNVSHTIHSLSFGESYPGRRSPLDGKVQLPPEGAGAYMYWMKVVPTVYARDGVSPLVTNQYSVTSQFSPALVRGQRQNLLPGVFFVYDISPFMVTVTESTTSFAQLVTSLCAILGGVLTAAQVVDAVLYRMSKQWKKFGRSGGAKDAPMAEGVQGQLVDAIASAVGSAVNAAASSGYLASPAAAHYRPAAAGPPPTSFASPAHSTHYNPGSPAAPAAYAGGSPVHQQPEFTGSPSSAGYAQPQQLHQRPYAPPAYTEKQA